MLEIKFNNSYAKLSVDFYQRLNPVPVKKPGLIAYNHELADDLGLAGLNPDKSESVDFFAGNNIPEDAEPLAMAYAGHQFGGFSHQLGDGRAILLGEVIAVDGIRYDIQLKGSGPTPFSRGGDGRAALGPILREYLLSEVMAKFGIATTRALAAVTTGEQVARQTLLPGAVLTRVAQGFVRVGTFEYFSAKGNQTALKQLADYEIDRHYPKAKEKKNPYAAFLTEVVERQAKLIAQWMQFGFIHGVMNTDNMSIVGETIDYGPCAFMDDFSHQRVFSSIDRDNRYAYNNQAQIGQWNLIRFAETILPLLGEGKAAVEIAQDILNGYRDLYTNYWLQGMSNKLGLAQQQDEDEVLIGSLLDSMAESKVDFTLLFFNLSRLNSTADEKDQEIRSLFSKPDQFDTWALKWRARLTKERVNDNDRQSRMKGVNPVYIPRNHQVEAAIRAAEDHNDFSVFKKLQQVLQDPFTVQQGKENYMLAPTAEQIVHQTFCGT